eukprot:m.16250 g.16250  ORF g.16250 m.16250 type:complete len:80 (-) comp5640_c0_seq1:157-396(-)
MSFLPLRIKKHGIGNWSLLSCICLSLIGVGSHSVFPMAYVGGALKNSSNSSILKTIKDVWGLKCKYVFQGDEDGMLDNC